jgi:hypothetical protein
MKRRHVLVGFGLILVLSLAVPALGGTLGLRPSGIVKVKRVATKALKRANAALAAASDAGTTARGAAAAASDAGATAKRAESAASDAGATARNAEASANTAKATASNAATTATAARSSAQAAATTAQAAATLAGAKFGYQKVVTHTEDGQGVFPVEVSCPANTVLTGGGISIPTGFPGLKASSPSGNGWVAVVNAGSSAVRVTVWAVCLSANPIP